MRSGVMMTPLMRTRQGFELQLSVNHLGFFALTSLLLPKLAETKGSRIVITALGVIPLPACSGSS
jgi:NAD(P)-dependent dehydrogenase (short-subunit alcohol dehydrogenase family)